MKLLLTTILFSFLTVSAFSQTPNINPVFGFTVYNSTAESGGANDLYVSSGIPGWNLIKIAAIPFQTTNGEWRLVFNFNASFTATSITSSTITVNGVVFDAAVSQSVSCFYSPVANSTPRLCSTATGSGNIQLRASSSGTSDSVFCSGDVEIDSKPTWVD